MRKKTVKQSNKALIYIIGESPMVEEYAELCTSKGYEVLTRWNETDNQTSKLKIAMRSSAIPSKTSLALELTNTDIDQKKKNLQKLDKALSPTSAVLSSSVTVTATEQSTWIKNRHRLVGIGILPTLSQRPLVEIAPTVYSPKETMEVVHRFFQSIGKEIEIVQDRVGMVLPRVLCQLINEAAFALQEDIASPQDIDTAMKLGTNYPFGPIEWADKIGVRQVYAVLSALENDLGEERYRASPLLKQVVQTGEWWRKK